MKVRLETTLGDVVLELDEAHAPQTTANFLAYVADGFYDGTLLHRVIDGFMIQGGGLLPGLRRKPTWAPIANEAANGLRNLRGTVAMARTSDPHSATSQFFVNVADNASLDFRREDAAGWGYCVFGQVVEGMDVVDRIRAVPTGAQDSHRDVPIEDVLIKRARALPE